MEETLNTQDQTPETTDGFLEGLDDMEPTADQPEIPSETTQDSAPHEQTKAESGEEPQPAQEPPAEAEEGPAEEPPKTWTLQHLGESRTVNEAEMTALAQKGLDYDRLREKYDEFKPVMDMFSQFANRSGMNTRDYISYIRQEAKKSEGMSSEEAQRAVELEDREATVAAKEAAEADQRKAVEAAEAKKRSDEDRRMADIQEFQNTFPEAAKAPKDIPAEVWDGVRNGLSLTASYARWQVEQARAEAERYQHAAEAAQKNQKNAERSTGSMKSAGEEGNSKDDFLRGFDS